MAPASQYELNSPPKDAIAAVAFAPSKENNLLAASWDGGVYLYNIEGGDNSQGELIQRFEYRAPVLDVCYGVNDDEAFTACADKQVVQLHLETGNKILMSTHNAPVRNVVYNSEYELLISSSWDSTLHVHAPRDGAKAPITIPLPGKPHAMALSASKLVVCMASRLVSVYSLESLAAAMGKPGSAPPQPFQNRESSLKYLTRAVSCMPGDGDSLYASSSIEGRVAVEFFDEDAAVQARKYAFKCHRQPDGSSAAAGDVVYPVNALVFHPIYGTFATGGGDGFVALWDAEAKRRMKQYQKFPESVAALAFSNKGRYLAVATCPGFETGQEDYSGADGRTKLFIRELGESEAKPKGAK